MINVDFTNIDNARIVGRVLPFWARGKKTSLLLQALLKPLISVHDNFKAWALDKYIDCHVTAQKASLEWYLKYKLGSHFRNSEDKFLITHGVNEELACFSGEKWRSSLPWYNNLRWGADVVPEGLPDTNLNLTCYSTGLWENSFLWGEALYWENEPNDQQYDDEYLESSGHTNVYAPAIVETISYSQEDYERDIRYIMARFMVNFSRINIIMLDPGN